MNSAPTMLILGWGNPGRLDDGLGPACIEELSKHVPPGVELDSDYQLTMEDAAEVARHERVLFVDADRAAPAPFRVRRLAASRRSSSFSTHSVAPGAVLSLCRDLFQAEPEAWLMGIRGYEFDEFGERLSERARENLSRAVDFIRRSVADGELREIGVAGNDGPPHDSDLEGERCPTTNA